MFFEPIASLIPPPNTHPHGHTATHPYQVPHSSIIEGADAGLAITAVVFRSKSAWRIPSSARQQRVSHDGNSVRYRSHAANNGCACCSFGGYRQSATSRTYCSFGGFRRSPKPSTRWDEVRRAVARGESAKHRAANRFRLPNSRTSSHNRL